ncbi:hypothetical protein DFH09DRAFT_1152676 [Mycena vulgaris]|nr:hypothetical protein DFH09DRAFT_1152676 [Mycena vulgaris]
MNPDPIAELGYESDTGPRDNPTCANFETKEPVKKTIIVGKSKKVLNRKGRAICRIAYAHMWSIGDIAEIFGVSTTSISRAVENTKYLPRDNVREDYDHVDPEFKEKFPPLPAPLPPPKLETPPRAIYLGTSDDEDKDEGDAEFLWNGRPPRAAKDIVYKRFREADDEDDDSDSPPDPLQPPLNRSHEDAPVPKTSSSSPLTQIPLTAPTAKKPRYEQEAPVNQSPIRRPGVSIFAHLRPMGSQNSSVSAPAPRSRPPSETQVPHGPAPLPKRSLPLPLPKPQPTTPALASFLKNVMGNDLSAHHALLEAQGFTMPRLNIIVHWGRETIEETVSRLLMGASASLGGRKGLSAFEVVSLELAIRKLKAKTPGAAPSLGRLLLLPSDANPNNSAATLATLLKNVMGFDLSAHRGWVEAQGFDLARLSAMATWDRGDLQEVLGRTLKTDDTKRGMRPLEILALELAIRRGAAAG